MDPISKVDDSVGCSPDIATGPDLCRLETGMAATLTTLEPPRVEHSTSPELDADLEEVEDCVDNDEVQDESESPPPVQGPPDNSTSQVELELDLEDLSHPPIRDKGKQPQRDSLVLDQHLTEPGSSSNAPPVSTPRGSHNPPRSTAGLAHGQLIPWELDPERQAQKLPIRFRDALGRYMLIPWKRAKTWEGMKMTIDGQFIGIQIDGDNMEAPLETAVANGRYSLHVTLPSSVEPPKLKTSARHKSSKNSGRKKSGNSGPSDTHADGSNLNVGEGSSHNDQLPERGTNGSNAEGPVASRAPGNSEVSQSPMPPMIVLPEFWDDLIQPGSYVSMTMWPLRSRPPFDVPMMPPMPTGMPVGMPAGLPPGAPVVMPNPPMAPPHPRFVRVIDLTNNSRPKTRARTKRARKMVPTIH